MSTGEAPSRDESTLCSPSRTCVTPELDPPGKQWAAVRTWRSSIRLPPQTARNRPPDRGRPRTAAHGQAPCRASVPPMMRVANGDLPHRVLGGGVVVVLRVVVVVGGLGVVPDPPPPPPRFEQQRVRSNLS